MRSRVAAAAIGIALATISASWPPVVSANLRPEASTFTTADVARVDKLLSLIQDRLERAPSIAELRWKTMSRIEDQDSERMLLDAVRKQSAALRLDADLAVRFAQAQIDAGKLIQAERHKRWAAEPAQSPPRQHVRDPLRASTHEPELGLPMLTAFRDALGVLRRPGARGLLDARAADLIKVGGSDLLAAQAAMKPLYELAQ